MELKEVIGRRRSIRFIDSCSARALLRKSPMDAIQGSIWAGVAAANAAGVGKRANSAGVTLLTDASVAWAERMVAASNSWGAP